MADEETDPENPKTTLHRYLQFRHARVEAAARAAAGPSPAVHQGETTVP